MQEVTIQPIRVELLRSAFHPDRLELFQKGAQAARSLFHGRTIWNINSTARGGGVAEMLQPLIAYARGEKIDVRWLVIEGNEPFFAVTKRLHNNIHDHPGDGGDLGREEHAAFRATTAENAAALAQYINEGDIVICHDPQTAGLLDAVRKSGAIPIWRCHIGHVNETELTNRAWRFLDPYVSHSERCVFSRQAYVPPTMDPKRAWIIQPSIDPMSPKNQQMSDDVVRAILVKTGIIEGPAGSAEPIYRRENGKSAHVERAADMIHLGRPPTQDRRLVVQVSRWDHLKDPIGVMQGFAQYLARDSASLVLAGPNVSAVADDPEGGIVLDEVEQAWRKLPHETRKHIHIACLPMADREENAAIVNALQRHATVIVQKSLYEGFGLTVTEAMWKIRPVVATAVGGIQDQITHGEHGLLLDDPHDLKGFADAVTRLLQDRAYAAKLATNGRRRVGEEFLFTRHLLQYLELFESLID